MRQAHSTTPGEDPPQVAPEATRREGQRRGRCIMRLPRRAPLLLLALLLTSTATAHGECAWVMWEQWFAPSSPVSLSFARTGTSSEAACRSELRKAIAVVEAIPPNPGEEQHVDGDAVVFVIREGDSLKLSGVRNFLCLPDTVDPRGRKGK